uniref:Plac8 onzin related protein 6 n=1 Tax=Esox lucius TaxID=8010 RepID=A0AAY5KPP3_ESOLU
LQQMPVVNIQPGMFQSPTDQKTTWSSGICDCCEDIQICECCFGFWCPCCLLCQISSDFGECFCLCLLDMFSGCIPSTSMALRSTMRERFRIQGSICSDCAVVTFCTQCSWCQMAREMKVRRRPHVFANAPSSVQIHMHAAQPMAYTTTPPTGLYPPAP